ncbi:hypothetical protein D3C76_1795630 [compost metagenome]
MRDYDDQRKAGVNQPVFDSAKFADLDLDRNAWPANPQVEPAAGNATGQVQPQR